MLSTSTHLDLFVISSLLVLRFVHLQASTEGIVPANKPFPFFPLSNSDYLSERIVLSGRQHPYALHPSIIGLFLLRTTVPVSAI